MGHGPSLKEAILGQHGHGNRIDDRNARIGASRHPQAHEKASNHVGRQVGEEGATRRFRGTGRGRAWYPSGIVPVDGFGFVTGQAKQFFGEKAQDFSQVAEQGQ